MAKLSENMRQWMRLQHQSTMSASEDRWRCLMLELAQQVEAQAEQLDALRGGYAEQPSVDRKLVEEAVTKIRELRQSHYQSSWMAERLTEIVYVLRHALEGDSDARED